MNFTKITSADTKNKGNKGKADTPSVSTSEMQRILDELSLEVIIPKFNTLSQELDLADIYGRVRSGDVKAVRVNADNQLEISTDGVTFEAIGSSGHLVIDKNGTMLPQRGRLRFNGDVTIADDAATNTTAISGLKGDKGDKGEQGMQGIQGVQGVEGKVYTPNISDTGDISWQLINTGGIAPAVRNIRGPQGIDGKQGIQGVQGAPGIKGETGAQGIKGDTGAQGVQGMQGIPGAAGAKGETGAQGPIGPQGMAGGAGADGRSFTTHGRYDTFADLQREHPKGVDGDAWLVGSIGDNDVYIWDIVRVKWECVGPIVGPMGAQGIQGIQGLKGDKGDAGAAGAAGQQGAQGVAGAKGDKGEQGLRGDTGAQGIQGIQGQQGERGLQGVQGAQGLRGAPTTVNGKTGENISLTAADVGALAPSGTAANASMLGGQQPSYYQPKSDSTLATSNKTVVGAINEVRSTASSAQSAANSASSTANSAYS
ncbi:MAG: collagen-like protein, partial [Oscillospiraceae bacterium]